MSRCLLINFVLSTALPIINFLVIFSYEINLTSNKSRLYIPCTYLTSESLPMQVPEGGFTRVDCSEVPNEKTHFFDLA